MKGCFLKSFSDYKITEKFTTLEAVVNVDHNRGLEI